MSPPWLRALRSALSSGKTRSIWPGPAAPPACCVLRTNSEEICETYLLGGRT